MPAAAQATHPLLLAVPWAAFYVSVFGLLYGAYQIVYLGVELGARQQQSIDALEANPASFVWYTLDCLPSNSPRHQKRMTPRKGGIDRWHQATGRQHLPKIMILPTCSSRPTGPGPGPRRGRPRAVEKALRGPGFQGHGQAPPRRVVRQSPADAAGGVSRRLLFR